MKSSQLGVFHANHNLELFITSRALTSHLTKIFQGLPKILKLVFALQNPCRIWKACANSFRNLTISNGLCAKYQQSERKQMVIQKAYLKTSEASFHFAHLIPHCEKLDATLQISFLSNGHPATTNLKKRPPPLTPFRPWCASEEAIPTLQYLARPSQEPPLLSIHLRSLKPRSFHLLKAGFL